MTQTVTDHRIHVIPDSHLSVDIQGNFHRGLMIGGLVGFFLGIIVVAAGALALLALR